uniref:Uncharacterized protein n=1 Tax=Oryza sativa subsp. japonica TaxID=39947 RepID=Q8S7C9_ORYSJ|nr:hypothetical protein [Oryza sativa Japonica Group]
MGASLQLIQDHNDKRALCENQLQLPRSSRAGGSGGENPSRPHRHSTSSISSPLELAKTQQLDGLHLGATRTGEADELAGSFGGGAEVAEQPGHHGGGSAMLGDGSVALGRGGGSTGRRRRWLAAGNLSRQRRRRSVTVAQGFGGRDGQTHLPCPDSAHSSTFCSGGEAAGCGCVEETGRLAPMWRGRRRLRRLAVAVAEVAAVAVRCAGRWWLKAAGMASAEGACGGGGDVGGGEGVGCEVRWLGVQQQRLRWWGGRLGARGAGGGDGDQLGARGAPDGGRPDWRERLVRWRRPTWRERRGRRWRRRPRCGEELPVSVARFSAHEGWPAEDVGAGVSHVGRACMVVEHQCFSHGFAGGERRVKTQSGLGRTDNDGSFPLLRALSCCLTPQGALQSSACFVRLYLPAKFQASTPVPLRELNHPESS